MYNSSKTLSNKKTEYSEELEKRLVSLAKKTRIDIVTMIAEAGLGHMGGSLSVVEILVILYELYLCVDAEHPEDPERDRFVLSKGHAGPCLYSILARRGFFDSSLLWTMNRGGTRLPSHVDHLLTPGVDCTTGSLGQGLSMAIGMAYAARIKKSNLHVYALLSDGECDEGQTWEAAMSCAHFGLGNLMGFVDCNKFQIDGPTKNVMDLEDLEAKWNSFGWITRRIDGHDFQALYNTIEELRELGATAKRPQMIICDTIKGKGHPDLEGRRVSHHLNVSKKDITLCATHIHYDS